MADGLSEPTKQDETTILEAQAITPAEKAQEYLGQLRKAVITQGAVFLHMGYLLKTIKEEELYKYMGQGGYDSFRSFLGGPELSISQATAYCLLAIYQRYIDKFKYLEKDIQDVPWSKLQMLASLEVETKEEADEWLEKARTLGAGDFRTEVSEHKANKGHEHPIPYPRVYRCKDCSMWRVEVDPQYSCHCVEPTL